MASGANVIDARLLRRLGLPRPDELDDKEARGRVLVVGGSRETPGAVVLAGLAALRTGAGKLRIATVQGSAQHVAAAVPEARVYALRETKAGEIAPASAEKIGELLDGVDAACVGPGMIDEASAARLLRKVLPCASDVRVVIDANALVCLRGGPGVLGGMAGRVVITPQAEEMAALLSTGKDEVERSRRETAARAARGLGVVVALKGRETFVAGPGAEGPFVNRAGNVGLATSGSGDVLAGLIAGLLARGAQPLSAAAWGVHAHALAGDRLARRTGPLGFLARELLKEIPAVLARLEGRRGAK
jgi:ADP-dependent NAD(P)H-hydrate dehydratase